LIYASGSIASEKSTKRRAFLLLNRLYCVGETHTGSRQIFSNFNILHTRHKSRFLHLIGGQSGVVFEGGRNYYHANQFLLRRRGLQEAFEQERGDLTAGWPGVLRQQVCCARFHTDAFGD
jgi:hypothetical protein